MHRRGNGLCGCSGKRKLRGGDILENIICYQKSYGGILKIARPQVLNALNIQVLEELEKALDSILLWKPRCLVVTGEGKRAFVAGADIGQMSGLSRRAAFEFGKKGKEVFRKLEEFPAPVIGVVNGYALGGGCELALCCDIRICSENAVFGQPEVGLGIIPGFGGTQRLSRLIGTAKAKEMIFTGENIDASAALKMGLVNAVYPLEELEKEADLLAERIVKNSYVAVKNSKKAIDQGMEMNLADGLENENNLFADCFEKKDQIKRMQAFLEKRGRRG